MSSPTFAVVEDGTDLVATTTDPRLRGLVWRWTPGTGQVEYGLPGHPVGTVNVWDYRRGISEIDGTPEALRAVLEDRYTDPENVAAVRAEVAHGD